MMTWKKYVHSRRKGKDDRTLTGKRIRLKRCIFTFLAKVEPPAVLFPRGIAILRTHVAENKTVVRTPTQTRACSLAGLWVSTCWRVARAARSICHIPRNL
mmetsp:Transcript_6935/g.10976  ORF Transcript_6935/g.10976 Transcript_6935/m.10976 type:complete len:100 (-) Transcript_6935:765-1064(-)